MKKVIYLFVLSVVVFACSSGSKSNYEEAEEETTETATEESTESTTEESTQSKDIVELASETEILSTLVTAVTAGDLVSALKSEGPYTVFAPTNDAFSALPEGTLENLLKPENKDQLVSILTYHVVEGKVMSSDLTDGMEATTLNGKTITINLTNGVQANNSNVVSADIEASNGVVHVIDAVLIPSD